MKDRLYIKHWSLMIITRTLVRSNETIKKHFKA